MSRIHVYTSVTQEQGLRRAVRRNEEVLDIPQLAELVRLGFTGLKDIRGVIFTREKGEDFGPAGFNNELKRVGVGGVDGLHLFPGTRGSMIARSITERAFVVGENGHEE